MKIKGDITMIIDRDCTRIEIRDRGANTTILRLELTPEQLSSMLSRQAHIDCDIDVGILEKVGKTHKNDSFEFKIPNCFTGYDHKVEIVKHAQSLVPDGWICDKYMGSQNSFFTKDGENWGRIIIRTWI
jgi:hypothetical protein